MDRVRSAGELLSEDVALMRAGKLQVLSHGFEVTTEHRKRLESVLYKLESFVSTETGLAPRLPKSNRARRRQPDNSMPSASLLVALCAQNARILEERSELIEAGEMKIILRGEDITDVELAGIRSNLGRLLQIMEALDGDRV